NQLNRNHDGLADYIDDDEEFPEGRLLTRLHTLRERNRGLTEKAKRAALQKNGKVACQACGFEFYPVYGDLGLNFIEAHHLLPVSSAGISKPKIKDIALLCSNCHRMVHKRRPWLSLAELQNLVQQHGKRKAAPG